MIAGGLIGNVSEIPIEGIGNSAATLNGGNINTAGNANEAESLPRAGTITSFNAYASTSLALTLLGTISIQAQLYESAAPNDTFSPVAGTTVTLSPSLSGLIATGTISTGSVTGLSIPVTAQARMMVVFSLNGGTLVNTVSAFTSAGVGIN
jgi:BclB C-terminal domain-containing protein